MDLSKVIQGGCLDSRVPNEVARELERIVLALHRRNGGCLDHLNLEHRLLDSSLGIDSLDLAEIMVLVERRFGCSPFDGPNPPRTWQEIVEYLQQHQSA